MTLSLCMIVRDEEVMLPQCLDSVRDVVDEMVILDTGSTDRTIAIAQEFGARVYSVPWRNDFAAARNQSLTYAEGDWILVLDADEILVADSIPLIKQVIQIETALVVNLVRQEIGAIQAPYSLISRLFRRHPDLYFFRPYHELIDDSVMALMQRQPHWQVLELPGVTIHHTGYQAATIAQRQKGDRARRIMEGYLTDHPDDAYICNKLGALYADAGNLSKGMELLQRGLKGIQTDPPLLYELHYHLGSTYDQMQDSTQAEYHYRAAIEQPISARIKLAAYNNLGRLLEDRGDWLGAKDLYQKTIEINSQFAIGYCNLGLVLKTLGNLTDAIAQYQQAIQINPTYAEAYQNLGVALLKLGQIPDSMAAFRHAIALYNQQGSAAGNRLQQGLQELGFSPNAWETKE